MKLLIDRRRARTDFFSQPLMPAVRIEKSAEAIVLSFAKRRQTLGSCLLGGGLSEVDHIVNLCVPEQAAYRHSPQQTVSFFCQGRRLRGTAAGMMTAASMNSLRVAYWAQDDLALAVVVTCGLANARCAGDRAEWRQLQAVAPAPGTINTVIISSACLSDAAMVEAMMLATEAKTVALREAGVTSPVSGKIATGTGTDALVLVNGSDGEPIEYCGKHTLLGEQLAQLVIAATADSLHYAEEIA